MTAILVSVILHTATGGTEHRHDAAFAVGWTVALLELSASPISGSSMNPARTLGSDIVGVNFTGWWVYVFGELIGAAIAVVIIILVRGRRTRPSGRRPKVARCRSEQSRSHPDSVVAAVTTERVKYLPCKSQAGPRSRGEINSLAGRAQRRRVMRHTESIPSGADRSVPHGPGRFCCIASTRGRSVAGHLAMAMGIDLRRRTRSHHGRGSGRVVVHGCVGLPAPVSSAAAAACSEAHPLWVMRSGIGHCQMIRGRYGRLIATARSVGVEATHATGSTSGAAGQYVDGAKRLSSGGSRPRRGPVTCLQAEGAAK
jgi:Major intrinsic protein